MLKQEYNVDFSFQFPWTSNIYPNWIFFGVLETKLAPKKAEMHFMTGCERDLLISGLKFSSFLLLSTLSSINVNEKA